VNNTCHRRNQSAQANPSHARKGSGRATERRSRHPHARAGKRGAEERIRTRISLVMGKEQTRQRARERAMDLPQSLQSVVCLHPVP